MPFNIHRKDLLSIPCCLALFLLPIFTFGILSCSRSADEARDLVERWRLEEAQPLLERAVGRNPDDLALRIAYARVLLARGELSAARDQYLILETLDPAAASAHRVQRGFALYYLGELDSAGTLARETLAAGNAYGDEAISARCHHLLGLVDFNKGKYANAVVEQEQSLDAARRLHLTLDEANALRQLGVLAWYRGNVDSALVHFYLPALELYRKVNDKQGEATTLSNIGLLYNDKSDRLTGLRYQLEAFRIRRAIGDQRGLADSYYFLTAAGTRGKTYGFVYTYRMKSLQLSRKIGYRWGESVAAKSLEELVPDVFLSKVTEKVALDTATAEGRLFSLWRRSLTSFGQGEWQSSIDVLRAILGLCDSLGYVQGRQVALSMYGRALSNLNRLNEAEDMLIRARKASVSVASIDNELLDLELARIWIRQGKAGQATRALRSIAEKFDSLFLHYVRNPGIVFSRERAAEAVFEARSGAYRLLAETQLQNRDEVFRVIEEERARLFWGKRPGGAGEEGEERDAVGMYVRLLEQYDENPEHIEDKALLDARITELQETAIAEQRIMTEAGDRFQARNVVSPAALRNSLENGEVFLHYYLAENTCIVLASRRAESRLVILDITPEDLTSSVGILRELLLRGKESPGDTLWKAPASFLFQALLEPLQTRGLIGQGDHLIISPHRILHLLPFQVLLTKDRNGDDIFVLQQNTVWTVPSATWLTETRAREPASLRSILAAAPLGKTLPFAEEEVKRIPTRGFANVKVLAGGDATVGEIVRLFPRHDIVHLATHSRMNYRYPLYSYIECSDDRLELHELFNHSGPGRLVILSACESGMSTGIRDREYLSEDIVSFPRALLQIGVPSVISSLWLVEDESAAAIFEEFYTALSKPGDSGALAGSLTHAQRRFLANSADKGRTHPFYWGSFQLFGDNR